MSHTSDARRRTPSDACPITPSDARRIARARLTARARLWLALAALAALAVLGTPAGAQVPSLSNPTPWDDQFDAQVKSGHVTIPPGFWALKRPHVDPGISISGSDESSILIVSGTLPGPAIDLTGNGVDNVRPHLSNFRLIGPGRLVLGSRTAGMDGIKVETQATLTSVRVEQFDADLNIASTAGHVFCRDCTFTAGYYNAYFTVGGGNYLFDACFMDGAGWASIGLSAGAGVEGLRVVSTHLGYCPYGVYQEKVAAGQSPARLFLCDTEFDQAWFEQIGLAAIKSEWAGVDGGPRCEFRDVTIRDCGYSAGPAFAPPGAAPEAGTVIGDYMSDTFSYSPGNHPFGPGESGRVFRFCRLNGTTGDTQFVGPGITINGVPPLSMP